MAHLSRWAFYLVRQGWRVSATGLLWWSLAITRRASTLADPVYMCAVDALNKYLAQAVRGRLTLALKGEALAVQVGFQGPLILRRPC